MCIVTYEVEEKDIPAIKRINKEIQGYKNKRITKKEYFLNKHNLILIRRHYFLITPLFDFWDLLLLSNKISIIGIVVAIAINIIAWIFFKC